MAEDDEAIGSVVAGVPVQTGTEGAVGTGALTEYADELLPVSLLGARAMDIYICRSDGQLQLQRREGIGQGTAVNKRS